jgi:hypothetical protein
MFQRSCMGMLVVALLLGTRLAAAAEPIPTGKDAATKAAWVKQLLARELQRVEWYRQHTRDSEKVREAAAAFLTAETKRDAFEMHNFGELYKQGNAVLAAGSKDPFVLDTAGWAAYRVNRFDEARARFEQARAAVDSSTYPAEMKFRAHSSWQSYLWFIRLERTWFDGFRGF